MYTIPIRSTKTGPVRGTVVLTKDGSGYSYEVRVNGLIVAAGWSRGSKKDVLEDAKYEVRLLDR
jgi:hypothetical protein